MVLGKGDLLGYCGGEKEGQEEEKIFHAMLGNIIRI